MGEARPSKNPYINTTTRCFIYWISTVPVWLGALRSRSSNLVALMLF